jgi:hypothetical protein
MPTSPNAVSEEQPSNPLFTGFYIFGRVVLLLMVVGIVYALWMVAKNWSSVGV